jgi:predicted transcriptional regulator/DNA-binding XRE family transcriptional regulator
MGKLLGKIVEARALNKLGETANIGQSLKRLRTLCCLTQVELAERLNIQQAAISKIEQGGDVHLSTVRKYIEALGASLRIDASFPANTPLALHIREAFDVEKTSDDQLVLPLLGNDPFLAQRDMILSIRPQYSEKIIAGSKTVELRRRFPMSAPKGTIAYIYSTSPVRAIVGVAEISDVLKLPVPQIWTRFKRTAFIDKSDFDRYFEGTEHGFALLFKEVRAFSKPMSLVDLREKFGFEPPQSFLYAKHDLRKALKHESAVVSH